MKRRSLLSVPFLATAALAKIPRLEGDEQAQRMQSASRVSGIPVDRVKITGWMPDTCGCYLEYIWDRATLNEPEKRTHIPFLAKCCEHHACHATPEAAHTAVIAENQAKNRAVTAEAERRGVPAETVKWAYDRQRNLTVEG